jgi:hypothetical protein|eukprot:COSAG03_NODE_583_length_6860_cov_9.293300_8_plen_92_part_00
MLGWSRFQQQYHQQQQSLAVPAPAVPPTPLSSAEDGGGGVVVSAPLPAPDGHHGHLLQATETLQTAESDYTEMTVGSPTTYDMAVSREDEV